MEQGCYEPLCSCHAAASRTPRERRRASRGSHGYTLIEMLATLLILALLLGAAVPGAQDMVARNRANSAMMQLHALLGYARQGAITMHKEITLCGTSDGSSCASTWDAQPTLVFIDSNLNRRLDSGERLLLQSELTRAADIRWRASGSRNYLRYQSDGGLGEFGNFLYCPSNHDPHFARQLILSATGRPRHAQDSNGDGIVEDRNGLALDCAS
jgi:type IV fimbrial biogenesis protein FimT